MYTPRINKINAAINKKFEESPPLDADAEGSSPSMVSSKPNSPPVPFPRIGLFLEIGLRKFIVEDFVATTLKDLIAAKKALVYFV